MGESATFVVHCHVATVLYPSRFIVIKPQEYIKDTRWGVWGLTLGLRPSGVWFWYYQTLDGVGTYSHAVGPTSGCHSFECGDDCGAEGDLATHFSVMARVGIAWLQKNIIVIFHRWLPLDSLRGGLGFDSHFRRL